MALIKNTSDNTHIMRDYEVSHAKTRKSALEWVALISQKKEICVKRIELRDFVSFDDGTVSDTLSKIENVNAFVDSYKDSAIESASIVGKYGDSSFNLSVNLDSGYIGLCFRKKDQLDFESLERLLGLV